MHHPRSILLVLATASLVAACGSSSATPTPTPGGGGGGGGGGGNPTANTGGGGGGGGGSKPAGWDRYGKVTYTISGPMSASGELGFSPPGSVFGGGQVILSFFDDSLSGTILSLRSDGTTVFTQFGDGKIVFASDGCQTSNLKIEALAASGSFDCNGVGITAAGATLQSVKMKGTFTAKAT